MTIREFDVKTNQGKTRDWSEKENIDHLKSYINDLKKLSFKDFLSLNAPEENSFIEAFIEQSLLDEANGKKLSPKLEKYILGYQKAVSDFPKISDEITQLEAKLKKMTKNGASQ